MSGYTLRRFFADLLLTHFEPFRRFLRQVLGFATRLGGLGFEILSFGG